jgi:hypothetical protein
MSLDLAQKCHEFVTTVVVNDDLVPRLSLGTLEDLKDIVKQLLEGKDGNLARLFQVVATGNTLGESLTKRISSLLNCSTKPSFLFKQRPSEALYPPGSIYHLCPHQPRQYPYQSLEESHPSLFGSIVISNTMLTDHLPDVYEECLQNSLNFAQANPVSLENSRPVETNFDTILPQTQKEV